ncbi:LOW QUALITY PROTEIN: G-type lectin S-receptor-like serine/threonine-protein kinase LECRK3 [Gossypium arboreum]|uniref:LOW QUALITY PROTEIN: G-type lectin S-receptor-like serine/threonine-protein kinase LECRK3 n=1 Tax=Gossypium arboreum TaxID=29729 RepID=UPI0022F1931F|nr:LOW QUALITY PROTEIN: G-type lectin S-receptor-like serine/threonine-protein kinase LECRK3 [Gossypium arboreum]
MAFDFKLQCPFCFFLFFLLLLYTTTAQSYSNISLGLSFVAQDDNLVWRASRSGDFAVGFRKMEMDGFLLSIWFDKIPEKTVVWSANRNDPVEKGSIVELTTGGNLVVKDQKGRQIWSSISADTGVSYAALLDTGNLVLASQDNTILWQSFENPTDTLLPTQTMKLDTQVIAHYTETNYSSGRYKFMLQRDGNLLLYTTNFPFNDAVAAYWSTQFKAEVAAIGRSNHKNLVHLLGYCNEGQNRLLVYEYMRNGSLAKFLFKISRPNLYERTRIALGIAEGLCYLHEQCSSRIIHCDIKPENILLDDTFSPRISDFGLSKLLKNDQSRTTTAIRGTKGYVAPEWFKNMAITIKVDVYSFGILLLEVICCRKNFEQDVEEEEEMILADWVYDCYKSGTLHCLVEKDEEAMKDMKKVKKFVMIAIWCIQEDPSLRPMMKKVIQMMEGAVEVPVPPDPNSIFSSI